MTESNVMSAGQWQPIATCPDKTVVMTKIDDGNGVRNEQPLKRSGRLFWTTDGAMYVYYTPTHWKPFAHLLRTNRNDNHTDYPMELESQIQERHGRSPDDAQGRSFV